MTSSGRRFRTAAVYLGIVALTAIIYGQTVHFGFVNYDDGSYVFQNPNITTGLTWHNLRWAFTHIHSQNWHPLTSISHMLDCQLFGVNAGWHHLTNLLLQAATAVLLFTFLWQATDAFWPSAVAAVLWAAHPLRVESVAWISERKDVLSGVFFALTLLMYLRYVRQPRGRWMILVGSMFALGLMCKPMLVTTPVILLLLDYWPLKRNRTTGLVLEKVPLFLLSAASAAATLIAQRLAVGTTQNLPLSYRLTNAAATYVIYAIQTVCPINLIPFYVHPESRLGLWQTVGSTLLILLALSLAFILRRRRPYLLTGFFWYFVMLIPVIGIVQVGLQGHADRYTYLPQIGLIIAAIWAASDFVSFSQLRGKIVAPVVTAIVALLAILSMRQTTHWRDTQSLWSYTLRVSPDNDVALTGLGGIEVLRDELAEAIAHYRHALELREGNAAAHHGLALALAKQRKFDEAISHWKRSLELRPDDTEASNYLGSALLTVGRTAEAIQQWEQTLQIDPENNDAANNLGWVFATSPDRTVRNGTKAIDYAQRSLRLPTGSTNPLFWRTLAAGYGTIGQFDKAIDAAEHAKELASSNFALQQELDRCIALFRQGKPWQPSTTR